MFDHAPLLRRRLRSLGAVGVAAAIALLAACGDDATSQQPTDRSTTTSESTAGLTDSDSASDGAAGSPTSDDDAGADVSTGGSANGEANDKANGKTTDEEIDVATNSRGVEITLDDPALLACAQNQLAWAALRHDGAGNPADALDLAADHAEASAVAEVKAEAPQLRSAADGKDRDVTVDRFLELCVSNGFEY